MRVARAEGADPALPLPSYRTEGAAGADLCACLPPDARQEGLRLGPGDLGRVPTGLRLAIPAGWEGQVRARSGLAARGLALPNGIGTIDADFRGEVVVLLVNLGPEAVTLQHGDRVAQLVLAPVARAAFEEGPLDDTPRGAGGFGSTGLAP